MKDTLDGEEYKPPEKVEKKVISKDTQPEASEMWTFKSDDPSIFSFLRSLKTGQMNKRRMLML